MERKTGKQMAEELSNFVNGATYQEKQEFVETVLADHRSLQQDTFSMFLQCISEWAKDAEANNYDARNERACKASLMMVKAFD